MLLVNKRKVIEEIDRYVAEHGVTYIDACVEYCSTHGIEVEALAAFIKATKALGLHGKVLSSAKELNLVKK